MSGGFILVFASFFAGIISTSANAIAVDAGDILLIQFTAPAGAFLGLRGHEFIGRNCRAGEVTDRKEMLFATMHGSAPPAPDPSKRLDELRQISRPR
jgi:hypothetical protein